MLTTTQKQAVMARGQLWADEHNRLHVVISNNAITEHSGFVITVLLDIDIELPAHSAFVCRLTFHPSDHSGYAVVGDGIQVVSPSYLKNHLDDLTNEQMDSVDAVLRAVLDL